MKKAINDKEREEVDILLQQFILEKGKIDSRSIKIKSLPEDTQDRTAEVMKQFRVTKPYSRLKVQAEMFLESTKPTASTTSSSSSPMTTQRKVKTVKKGQRCPN